MVIYFFVLVIVLIISSVLKTWEVLRQTQSLQPSQMGGFSRKFFSQVIPNYFFGLDSPDLISTTYNVVKLLSQMIPFRMNTVVIRNSIDSYQLLNDNKIQFMMARNHVLHNVVFKTMPGLADIKIDNIRVVAALYRLPVNIISMALNINELADLKGTGLSINVGQKYSGDYFVALDLLFAYGLIVGEDVFLKYYEWPELLRHYGDDVHVVINAMAHPNVIISGLTNKEVSRVVQIKKYNNGNIFDVTTEEAPFYKEHHYYTKTLLEKPFLRNYYPNLITDPKEFNPELEQPLVTNNLGKYLNTIGIRYYLLSNNKTLSTAVAQLLYNMKINMDEINKFPFIDEKIDSVTLADFKSDELGVLPHSGSRDFFFRSGLYTNINNPACIMIDGRCTMEDLYNHRFLRDFGLTFNEIYNSDTRAQDYLKTRAPPLEPKQETTTQAKSTVTT